MAFRARRPALHYAFDLRWDAHVERLLKGQTHHPLRADEYAATTHDRATTAWTNGLFDNESI